MQKHEIDNIRSTCLVVDHPIHINTIASSGIIHKHVSYSSHNFSILDNGRPAHDCCQQGTTFFSIFEILKEISPKLKVIMREMKEILTEILFLFQICVCCALSDSCICMIGVPHFVIKVIQVLLQKRQDFHPAFDFIFCRLC